MDGCFVAGSILETLESSLEEEKVGTSPRSTVVVAAAVLSAGECQTIVETLATLLQLRWIFQHHPTTTIYTSLLAAQQQQQHQGDDTSRDYLLLKGVLAHGLANELEFRVQQSNMTYSQVEDRFYWLTKLLFKYLYDLKKQDAAMALQRRYAVLMNL